MSSIANQVIDREAFYDIIDITDKHQWAKERYDELMNLWDLCYSRDERSLLKELIDDFFVLDKKEERFVSDEINKYFKKKNLKSDKTFIVSVCDVGKNDGSLSGLKILSQKITPTNEWKDSYINHISELKGKLNNCSNIVIFDDFIGSGNKIIKKYDWLAKVISNENLNIEKFNIFIVSFTAMKFGIKIIKENLNVEVYCPKELDKGISEKNSIIDRYFKIKLMLKIEKKLSDTYDNRPLSKYSLGYGKSESLYYWENISCPNNVFPIFWWERLKSNEMHKTLLMRVR
ncbi:phosphoribosyltransferase-like protein [Photobacterium andalusiense]|uniref:PRTase-CE domain-containing protein n=1 Tax=Photobacterium andalusiense TaxID=2204296 RepID=A0A1Y6MJH7_9GAMM|nr:hypothetical protein [Photobacterium andalusiense]SMY36059.1 hypothetical protein PAND9192_02388 [Photobacterium andalusiense]